MDGFTQVADGAYCEIWVANKAMKTYEDAPPQHRGRMKRILVHLSENGPNDLNDQQFKAEGRFACGKGRDVMVYAAKSYQLRIYGFWKKGSKLLLVCPETAIKKDNRANQEQLKRVAKKAGEL